MNWEESDKFTKIADIGVDAGMVCLVRLRLPRYGATLAGDGLYPVYARMTKDGRVAELRVVFVPED
jgi:hypothetical protein